MQETIPAINPSTDFFPILNLPNLLPIIAANESPTPIIVAGHNTDKSPSYLNNRSTLKINPTLTPNARYI